MNTGFVGAGRRARPSLKRRECTEALPYTWFVF